VHALSDANLCVGQGEFVAIMGPSGSGKSTLLHLIGGLDNPSDGQVLLAGRPLALLTDDEVTVIRRRQIGFVFQFLNLLPTLTAAENIALPLLLDGWRMKDCMARVQELLELVGLSSRRDHSPDQLSGGEQQRVAIARALIAEPLIVVADEPTGNLDTTAGREVLRLLRRACDEKGQTIVMVTHDPLAASHADRVIFLRDGRIVREVTGITEHGPQAILEIAAARED
jgi:putative ABC transport system ATP-binding protein